MADKLTINIVKDEQIISSVTYAGPVTTQGTFDQLCHLRNRLIRTVGSTQEIDEIELQLIRALEDMGGGVNPDKINVSRAVSEFPKEKFSTETADPAKGLVSIAPSAIRDDNTYSQDNPEPSIFDLDTGTATNHSYFIRPHVDGLEEVTFFSEGDLWDIPLKDLEKTADMVSGLPDEFVSATGKHISLLR